MNYQNTKKLNPTLKEVRFNEYILLCEGQIIKFAFLLEYLTRNKYVGNQHLHTSWIADIQTEYNKGLANANRSEQLSFFMQ